MYNYFFYGFVEDIISEKLQAFLTEHKKEVSYFKWKIPFTEFRLDKAPSQDIENLCKTFAIDNPLSSNELENSAQFEVARKNGSKKCFVVIENLHFFAHSAQDPSAFYKQLLDACNYYSSQLHIHFALSGIRIPQPFVKENPVPDKWKFIECNIEIDNHISGLEKELIKTLHQQKPRLTKYHLFKAVKFIEKRKKETGLIEEEVLKSQDFHIFMDSILETEGLYNSEVYADKDSSVEKVSVPDYEILRKRLKAAIIGQDEAVQRFIDATMIGYSSLIEKECPKAVFLLVGPSGVGKTEICRQLKEFLPGYRFLQINLSEYNERAAVDKLIGLGRGYEDSRTGGILTEPVRLYPRQVILFDEIDHAHGSAIQLFYKIFEGSIMDGRGRPVSFKDCFIIMTTNRGVVTGDVIREERRFAIEEKLIKETDSDKDGQCIFTQAFLGRIHSIIQFNTLCPFDLLLIAEKYFNEMIIHPYKEKNISIRFVIHGDSPGLLRNDYFNADRLFYEIFALLAFQKSDQGARRLFQLMDEHLIKAIELCRIKYCDETERRQFEMNINFRPFWPDDVGLDYDHTEILLIDDDSEEKGKLEKVCENKDGISIHQNDFNIGELSKAERASLILLDLYKDDKMVGKGFLNKIKDKRRDIPICIYSALAEGPQLDQLKANYWQYGIAEYISKSEDVDVIRTKLNRMIWKYYLNEKVKSKQLVKSLELLSPKRPDQSLNFNLEWII